MHRWLGLFGLLFFILLYPVRVWAQVPTPPLVVQTNDKATKCEPSFLIAVNNGSLSCPNVDGKPAAVINMGTPTATTPFNQVTGGANTNTLTVGAGGSLTPAGGTITATTLTPAGVAGNCVQWGTGGLPEDAGAPCAPGGANPDGPINAIQANKDNVQLLGSVRCGIDPTTGAVDCACTRTIAGDCTNELTSEAAQRPAPATVNRVAFYFKQVGTVYSICWHGNGDAGERCTAGTVTP